MPFKWNAFLIGDIRNLRCNVKVYPTTLNMKTVYIYSFKSTIDSCNFFTTF